MWSISTSTWRSRLVAPHTSSTPIPDGVLLTTLQRPSFSPAFFFAKYGRNRLRMASSTDAPQDAKPQAGQQWGTSVKLDSSKGILGLAGSPTDNHLAVLTADGVLRGYALNASGLSPLYASHIDPTLQGAKSLAPQGFLEFVPHPFMPSGSLLLYGVKHSGQIMAFEVASGAQPRALIKGTANKGLPLVGLAFDQGSKSLLAFSRGGAGDFLRVQMWKATTSAARDGGVQLVQVSR